MTVETEKNWKCGKYNICKNKSVKNKVWEGKREVYFHKILILNMEIGVTLYESRP